jgi:hypothetical protein
MLKWLNPPSAPTLEYFERVWPQLAAADIKQAAAWPGAVTTTTSVSSNSPTGPGTGLRVARPTRIAGSASPSPTACAW